MSYEDIFFVPIKGKATNFAVEIEQPQTLWYTLNGDIQYVPLPPGSWRFIALHSQMTEEKAIEIMDEELYQGPVRIFDDALTAYESLYRHLGLVGNRLC